MTDSRSPAEPKDPDTILALYRHLAASAAADDLARRYRAGGVGYAEAKALLAEAIQRLIGPAQARHAELMSDPAAPGHPGRRRDPGPQVSCGNAGGCPVGHRARLELIRGCWPSEFGDRLGIA